MPLYYSSADQICKCEVLNWFILCPRVEMIEVSVQKSLLQMIDVVLHIKNGYVWKA